MIKEKDKLHIECFRSIGLNPIDLIVTSEKTFENYCKYNSGAFFKYTLSEVEQRKYPNKDLGTMEEKDTYLHNLYVFDSLEKLSIFIDRYDSSKRTSQNQVYINFLKNNK